MAFNGEKLTLVLNELVEEAGFPRPGAANHQKLKQEVWKQRRGGRDQCNKLSWEENPQKQSWDSLLILLSSYLHSIQQPQISLLITKPGM